LSDADIRTLATLYERALRDGAPPTKTIQEWMGCSKPTASSAVKEARDQGFLGQPSMKELPSTPQNNWPS
jgi:Mn-dependent DtxR family transcriptional regulator